MKIIVSELKSCLDNIRAIIGRGRKTLPVLSCVKIHTERNRLHIAATNIEEYIVERVECEGEFEPVCVSFNQLDFALAGESATITASKGKILVKCGLDETEISTMDAEEFPPIPKMEKSTTHGVSGEDLGKAIKSVSWAASTDEARYVLQSVLIESDAKKLTVVATNGRELAMTNLALIGSKFTLLAPSNFAGNFADSLARKGAALSTSENWLRVAHDSGNYFCKQMEGNYPNYIQFIPKDMKPLGSVNAEQMEKLVAGCLGYDSNRSEAAAIFRFSKKELVVDFLGENNAKLTRNLAGIFQPLTIKLSLRKMALIFSHLETDEAKLFFVDELSPLKIESGDLSVLTMPHRLT